jgi:hypothetical protein
MIVDSRCAHGKRLGAFSKHKKLEHTLKKKRETSMGRGEISTFTFTPSSISALVQYGWRHLLGRPEERFDRNLSRLRQGKSKPDVPAIYVQM